MFANLKKKIVEESGEKMLNTMSQIGSRIQQQASSLNAGSRQSFGGSKQSINSEGMSGAADRETFGRNSKWRYQMHETVPVVEESLAVMSPSPEETKQTRLPASSPMTDCVDGQIPASESVMSGKASESPASDEDAPSKPAEAWKSDEVHGVPAASSNSDELHRAKAELSDKPLGTPTEASESKGDHHNCLCESEVEEIRKEFEERMKTVTEQLTRQLKQKTNEAETHKNRLLEEERSWRQKLEEQRKEMEEKSQLLQKKLRADLESQKELHQGQMAEWELKRKELEKQCHEYRCILEQVQKQSIQVNESHQSRIMELENQLDSMNTDLLEREAKWADERRVLNHRIDEECKEKDDLLMRNAEITQKVELSSQEQRNQIEALKQQISAMTKANATLQEKVEEKNRSLVVQQQRILDLRKTYQKEMQRVTSSASTVLPSSQINGSDGDSLRPSTPPLPHRSTPTRTPEPPDNSRAPTLTPSPAPPSLALSLSQTAPHSPLVEAGVDPMSSAYLKNVILRFLTCRECEAVHLIRAISVLLELTPSEQQLLRDTLEWRMSWFGTKPDPSKTLLHSPLPSAFRPMS
ncbi:unnamed protein product [Cyprideis torosa]|uniref:Uncharacterized protein n=1 Tax=Cyprideis torosa TaxID=163714 RepID=A0A7R8W6X3_9CRUS|nr:unnamed protein product [Cyprideis torosa]CAG0882170.1 unnamed protein product [Cyprideis torosa]